MKTRPMYFAALSATAIVLAAVLLLAATAMAQETTSQLTDVTTKVKEAVKDNALTMDATNDNFGDPAEGTLKQMQVDYTYDGKAMSAIVNENETMTIPTSKDKKDGAKLEIRKAVYGVLGKIDVTAKVKEAVKDNALSIDATNDNFGDPANGVGKNLRVEYTLDSKAMTETVAEGETMKLPKDGQKGKLEITSAVYGDLSKDPAKTSAQAGAAGGEAPSEYFCAMHPAVIRDQPGKCPICSMDLTKRAKSTAKPADVGAGQTDVTAKVKEAVKDDKLTIDATNDNFGDPAEGIGKELRVEYTLDGKEMKATVAENETMTLPKEGEKGKLVITKAVYGDFTK